MEERFRFEDLASSGDNILIIFRTGRHVSFKADNPKGILDSWMDNKSSFIKCSNNLIIRRSEVELIEIMDESMEKK